MRAWLMDSYAGIEALRCAETDEPRAGEGEVVLDVLYAALNPADYYLAEGQYPARPELPHVLGRDGLGVVREVGPPGERAGAVETWRVGDRALVLRGDVGVTRRGTFAERVAVPVESLVRPPDGWTDEQCACGTLAYLTAWQAVTQWTDLPRPANVLVTGASGGVGVATTQLATALGHRVVALSRSADKQRTLRALGADLALDPADERWPQRLVERLGGRKIDLAVDNVAGEHFPRVLDVLGPNGRASCVGRLAGPVPRFNTGSLFFRRLQVRGVSVGAYTAAESRAAWESLRRTLGRRRPLVDVVFAFDRLPEAFARLRGGPMGKVLLRVGDGGSGWRGSPEEA